MNKNLTKIIFYVFLKLSLFEFESNVTSFIKKFIIGRRLMFVICLGAITSRPSAEGARLYVSSFKARLLANFIE